MVGGEVVETVVTTDRVWVNCVEPQRRKQTCAIYVQRTPASECIDTGDMVWWQGGNAMWTPEGNRSKPESELTQGVDYDIVLKRIGYSGVPRPQEDVV